MAALLAVTVSVPVVFLPGRLETQALLGFERRARDVARAYAGASAPALDFRDPEGAAAILHGLAETYGARYAQLLASDGKILAAWGDAPGEPWQIADFGSNVERLHGGMLHVHAPVRTKSGEIGALRVGLSLEELQVRRRDARKLVATLAAVVFVMGLAAAFSVGQFLMAPLQRVSDLAERITRGDEEAARELDVKRGDEAGSVAVAFGSVLERLTDHRALLESQNEASNEAILTVDGSGHVLTHNQRFLEMWGLPGARVVGKPWAEIIGVIGPAILGSVPGWLDAAIPTLPGDLAETFDLHLRDGRFVACYAATVRRKTGVRLGIGLYLRDVTQQRLAEDRIRALNAELEDRVQERTRELGESNTELARRLEDLKRTQEQLVGADRRISLGRLAAGVAHEVNNPLAYVVANLRFIGGHLSGLIEVLREGDAGTRADAANRAEDLVAAATDAAEGADRVAHIVRSLKAFSRSDEERRQPVHLERAVEIAINMASHELRHRALVVRDYRPAPRVLADETRLSQVFLNLLINAAQSISPGATDQNRVTVSIATDEAGWAFVEISDTGSGIAPEILGRIYDPFFTTKPQGAGTGLGLSISMGIVTALGGRIEVQTEVGKGSRFRVTIAPCATAATTPAAAPPVVAPPARALQVLVVDDEPLVASAVRRMLERDHRVEIAASGSDALARIARGARFDAVLCDLMMPVMTGMEFLAEISRVAPDMARRVIFVTGGAVTEATAAFIAEHRFLEKPIDSDKLRRFLHELPRT